MENFGLDTPIMGMDAMSYMASLIEKNEKESIALERSKQSIGVLKQYHNHARIRLDAAKHILKAKQLELEMLEKEKSQQAGK